MKLHNGKSMFKWVAPKDEFIAHLRGASARAAAVHGAALPPRSRRRLLEEGTADAGRAQEALHAGAPIVEPKLPALASWASSSASNGTLAKMK